MTRSSSNNNVNKLPRQKPRTCVACRSEAPKRALLRIARKPDSSGIDTAVVDPTGKLPGRGAYICANPDCLEKAHKTGALARALKLRSLPDECYADLARCIEKYVNEFGPKNSAQESETGYQKNEADQEHQAVRMRELKSLIGLSRRAGLVKIGTDAIDSEVKSRHLALKHEALLILTAQDCSESVTRFAEKITASTHDSRDLALATSSSPSKHEHRVLPLTIEELSVALGAGKVQIIAMSLKGGLADKIKILLA